MLSIVGWANGPDADSASPTPELTRVWGAFWLSPPGQGRPPTNCLGWSSPSGSLKPICSPDLLFLGSKSWVEQWAATTSRTRWAPHLCPAHGRSVLGAPGAGALTNLLAARLSTSGQSSDPHTVPPGALSFWGILVHGSGVWGITPTAANPDPSLIPWGSVPCAIQVVPAHSCVCLRNMCPGQWGT